MKDIQNYSLKERNTFGIDAKCRRFIEFEDDDEAVEVAKILRESAIPYIIIGGGSNLLLTKDFDGIVVRSGIKGHYFEEPGDRSLESGDRSQESVARMTCGSGEVWDDMVATSIKAGYYGMENLSLIPGDVGASAVQNIGAYGLEAKDLIVSVEAVEIATGQVVTISGKDCGYGYRQSKFKQEWKNRYLITHVTYQLSTSFQPHLDYGNIRQELEKKGITEPTAQQVRDIIIDIRNAKLPDPKVMGNAGSFFMNPIVPKDKYETLAAQYPTMPHYEVDGSYEKIPAGWMIEQCGWKGKSLGRAGVHDKQALVLVNRGGATGAEIVALCDAIRKDVKTKFGIDIHPEVNII
ncbi:MAG: UDP-N-acetylmuramate dehydrogenase [Prevotella sp.]|nr:UDP-N-acetylmuramate dehydrogenase [Prevotella sp.]